MSTKSDPAKQQNHPICHQSVSPQITSAADKTDPNPNGFSGEPVHSEGRKWAPPSRASASVPVTQGDPAGPLNRLKIKGLGRSRYGDFYLRLSWVSEDGCRRVAQRSLYTPDLQTAKHRALALLLNGSFVHQPDANADPNRSSAGRALPIAPHTAAASVKFAGDWVACTLSEVLTRPHVYSSIPMPAQGGDEVTLEDVMVDIRELLKNARRYEVQVGSSVIRADSPEDHQRAMQALQALKEYEITRAAAQSSLSLPQAQATPPEAKLESASSPTSTGPSRREPSTLGTLIESYLQDPEFDKVSARTNNERRKILSDFLTLSGQRSVAEVFNPDFVSEWRRLEANRSSEKNPSQTLSAKTHEKRQGYLNKFIKWLAEMGHYTGTNPYARTLVPIKKGSSRANRYKPFKDSEIDKIFGPGYREEMDKPDAYWVPLMALFSGARLSEICGLKLKDFVEISGVKTFRIQTGKTVESARTVPIHPALLELGLWRHVECLKGRGYTRFLEDRSEKYEEKAVGRYWANRLDACDIKDRKKVFHSLRATAISQLHACNVSEQKIRFLVGHSIGGSGKDSHVGYVWQDLFEMSDFAAEIAKIRRPASMMQDLQLEDPTFDKHFKLFNNSRARRAGIAASHKAHRQAASMRKRKPTR